MGQLVILEAAQVAKLPRREGEAVRGVHAVFGGYPQLLELGDVRRRAERRDHLVAVIHAVVRLIILVVRLVAVRRKVKPTDLRDRRLRGDPRRSLVGRAAALEEDLEERQAVEHRLEVAEVVGLQVQEVRQRVEVHVRALVRR